MLALILARALQGLGGGGLMPLVQTIIGDVASPRDRPRYQGYTSATFILSTVGGPLIGGFIAQHFHWSWIFWLNLPLCALAYVLTHNVLQELPRHERPHRLDLLGAVLMVGAAIPLMLALTWGGRRYGWGAPEILGLFLASAVLWTCFAWRMMTAAEPFIPIAVLRDGAMCVGTASGFFAVGTMIALSIILPLYAQVVLGLSVTAAASTIIALQAGATVTSIIGGRLLVRFTHYKRVPVAALLVSIAALLPLAAAPTNFSPGAALALLTLAGFGLGPTFPFTVVVVQNAVALHQLGVATGAMNFFRALGATFIVTMFGAIVLAGGPLTRGMSSAAAVAAIDPNGFRFVFAAAALCLGVALVCVLFLEERPLRGSNPAASVVGG
jgi:MFS family permease